MGAGITWLKNNGFFTADYYPYNAGGLLSVKTSKKINRDINNVIIGEYPLDGSRKVHRVFGIVDLGSLEWSYSADLQLFYTYIDNRNNVPEKKSGLTNYIVYGYTTTTHEYADMLNLETRGTNDSSGVNFKNTAYSDIPTFTSAMSGVYLVYELATSFEETVFNPELRGVLKLDSNNKLYYYGDTCNDFTNPMQVDGNGTEEFVDTRAVQMPVGHSTIYGEDMKARNTDFGVTVFGGEFNLTTGVLTSTKNADGTDKNPPDVYNLTPASMPVRNGENYVLGNTNGDVNVEYIKKV